ncbi:uncharacterized protein LOC111297714, partial [Durio zibethinus]|uniref:Uncharacterized protein LOC111297714 n=1 Tax=Durio zibethinus TaxID=66656 RepID=A0A6P5Z5U4_DURZI
MGALNAIQISYAPNMLSYIADMTTAIDASNTSDEICQQSPKSDSNTRTESVAAVVKRTDILDLIKSIFRNDLEATNRLLTAKPQLINAEVFRTTVRRPIHLAVTAGNLEIVNELLSYMSEEDVKAQGSSGRTALHLVACSPGNTEIAKSLIGRNKKLLTFPDKHGFIPLSFACDRGNKDMTHYLYNETTLAYLLSRENKTQAASVVSSCIRSKLFDVALDMLRRCPKLAVAKTSVGSNAVLELSLQPSAFLSCCGLSFRQRMIYSSLSSGDDVRINTLEQQDQKETKNFMMQGKEKLFEFWSILLEFFGIKQLYDLKLTHVYAHELLLLISKTIAGLSVEEIHQSLVEEAIINASERGMTEFIVEIIKSNPDLLRTLDNDGKNIIEIAVAYRQEKVFSLIYAHEVLKYDLSTFADNYDNNLLHLAGLLEAQSQLKLDQISGAALQMQRELQWFKEVESIVPPAYKHRKNDGQ